ncbi:MAG: alpha/beta hydrolase-fold protein [Reichenbachiella sp.]|uniref:alpha/beta hydrolase n=1 Tax=Reichenbachiella sp. TaxID=2184521 RepID=UPI0032993F22
MKLFTLLILSLGYLLPSHAQKSRIIHSNLLNEDRLITIQLPDDYSTNEDSYGVLYVLDGEYAFDFAAGTVSFLSNTFGHMPPLIVVGIPNIDRLRDVNVRPNNQNNYAKFLKFIESELMSFVNENYRTNGFDILYGWSSAADVNFQFLAKNPNLFDAHIQSGTGIGPKNAAFLSEELPKHNYKNNYLYVGTEGSDPRAIGHKKYQNLVVKIAPRNLKYKFELMDSSSHVDVLGEAIYEGLKFIFNDFYIPDSVVLQGVTQIKNYYKSLDQNYNFQVKIPVGAFSESAGILFQSRPQEAINLLKYGLSIHPTSADLHGSLGEVYEYLDQKENATIYYQLAYEKSDSNLAAAMKYKYLSQKFKAEK